MIKKNKKLRIKNKNYNAGFTLVEMLVALLIFSTLGILVTRSLGLSLRGARKSESIAHVRENVSYAMGVMEQHLRNAKDLDCAASSSTKIIYTDSFGEEAYFECAGSFIASNSATARLTSSNVSIDCGTGVFIDCVDNLPGNVPDSVTISISASSTGFAGAEGFTVDSSTRVLLRTYDF